MPGNVCVCLFVTTLFVWTVGGLLSTSGRHDYNERHYLLQDASKESPPLSEKGGRHRETVELARGNVHQMKTVRSASGRSSWYTCGEGHCRCHGVRADCSKKGLTYIPQLPPEVAALDFSHNSAGDITDNFLVNISSLTNLTLTYNNIQNISAVAFRHLAHLAYLDLSNNNLTCRALAVVLHVPTLDTLKLCHTTWCKNLTDSVCTTPTLPPDTPDRGVRGTFPNLTELDLSGNKFQTVNMSCLSVFTGLRRLGLRGMKQAKYFSLAETLHSYKHLASLNLSYATLSCENLIGVLTTPSLEVLVIRDYAFSCLAFCHQNITNTTLPRLKELDLSGGLYRKFLLPCLLPFTGLERLVIDGIENHWSEPVIDGYVSLPLMKHLAYIDVSNNHLSCEAFVITLAVPSLKELKVRAGTSCGEFYRLPVNSSVVKLDLSHNNIRIIQLDSRYEHALDALELLDLSNNELSVIDSSIYYPKLQKIILKKNVLKDLLGIVGGNRSVFMPSLTTVDVSNNDLSRAFGPHQPVLTVPQLHSLTLDRNDIDFASVNVNMFNGLSNLLTLSVASNHLEGVTEERFGQLFGHLVHLKNLVLRSTGLTNITAGMFQGLTSLQHLDLSQNDLSALPGQVFKFLVHLTWINLSSNKLSVITESTFPLATRQHLQHMDLRKNSWLCSCDVLWFQSWLHFTPWLFAGRLSEYKCANMPDTPIASFFMQEQACNLSPQTSQFIIATVSMVLLGGSLFILLYHNRWHLRLILHEAFRGREDRLQRLRTQRFQFDVFVSYDSEDFPWVRSQLLPSLEEDMGLKLCIHHRDFIPGRTVIDNITQCLYSSKKMLVVFSREFSRSPWCQFELSLCLSHAVETDDMLIVVVLEGIPSRDLTSAMVAVMKTTTYIEWADGAAARDSFWQRLSLSLDEVMGGEGRELRN